MLGPVRGFVGERGVVAFGIAERLDGRHLEIIAALSIEGLPATVPDVRGEVMAEFILSILAAVRVFFRSRSELALEVLALRQQVAVLNRKRRHPKLNSLDRLFWTTLRRFWSRWSNVLVIVKPETVVGWHRAGFGLYWRWRSRPRGGRPKIPDEIRVLIRRMAEENPSWGAPRIHGELMKLGSIVSERTVARYLRTDLVAGVVKPKARKTSPFCESAPGRPATDGRVGS